MHLVKTHNGLRPSGTTLAEINHRCIEAGRKKTVRKVDPANPKSPTYTMWTISFDCGRCVGVEFA